jgi:hypothetical protein
MAELHEMQYNHNIVAELLTPDGALRDIFVPNTSFED